MTCTIKRAAPVPVSSVSPSEKPSKNTAVIELMWEGADDILIGKLVYESADQAIIEIESTPRGRCRGLLAHAASNSGSWTLACTNGIYTHGTIKGRATTEISGRGTDSRGRAVRIRLREAPTSKADGS